MAAQDFVFWDLPGRKVFKIHGSVDSFSSIVATSEDYDTSYSQLSNGLVGSNLKMLLATKVVVFVGYSLRDQDFLSVYKLLKEEMKDMLPTAYAVMPSGDSDGTLRSLGITTIATDGTFFLKTLKRHLVAEKLMISDAIFDRIFFEVFQLRRAHALLHKNFSYKKNLSYFIARFNWMAWLMRLAECFFAK